MVINKINRPTKYKIETILTLKEISLIRDKMQENMGVKYILHDGTTFNVQIERMEVDYTPYIGTKYYTCIIEARTPSEELFKLLRCEEGDEWRN